MSKDSLITLNQYIAKSKVFEIPNYQRGYVWGKSRRTNNNDTDSVSFFIDSLIKGFASESTMFLQGVTVTEQEDRIIIIDGQQRTTLMYLIMLYLGKAESLTIRYTVRKESDNFLQTLKSLSLEEIINICTSNEDEKYQDIYYFKKSIRLIHDKLRNNDAEKLYAYLLEKIKFLYINIPAANAASIFTMMNGNKADMLAQEVIKADLLRLVSQPRSEVILDEAARWDTNMTRSKYAREWDKWLHWWNRKDVQKFYNTTNAMGLLIETLYNSKGKDKLSYEGFKRAFLEENDKVKAAKDTFALLRKLQKRFEDVFHNYELHNTVGAIMHIQKHAQPFIQAYFVRTNEITDIDLYANLVYLGVNHTDIVKNNQKAIQEMYDYSLEILQNDNLYNEEDKEPAFRQLLRLNVQAYTDIKQSFDFDIWKERSLEHIFPKSKESELGPFDGEGGVHSIGNLVLLYKNDNSSFNASSFNDKKAIYFNLDKRKGFRSRNLLHTISVFASEKWSVEEIKKQKQAFLDELMKKYEQFNTVIADENA